MENEKQTKWDSEWISRNVLESRHESYDLQLLGNLMMLLSQRREIQRIGGDAAFTNIEYVNEKIKELLNL